MYNITVGLYIQIIGMMIITWNEIFLKLGIYFDGLVIRKELLLQSSHRIEIHIDLFVEIIEVHSSVTFGFFFIRR